jgi:hypothetical protein
MYKWITKDEWIWGVDVWIWIWMYGWIAMDEWIWVDVIGCGHISGCMNMGILLDRDIDIFTRNPMYASFAAHAHTFIDISSISGMNIECRR